MKQAIKTTALGNLMELIMGQAPSSKDCNFDGRGTPFVKVGEFREMRPEIREWTTNPLRMARQTDVLLCVVGATCGKINLGEECAIGRSVAAIRPHVEKLNQFYLYYFMMTLVERLRSGSVGAAQTVISKEMVETVQIPLVPLPEQQRIVGILDQAFDGIAKARANAEKNLKNASALFESYLQSVFTQRGEGWVEKRLGEFALSVSTGPFGSLLHKSDYVSEGVPLVNPINIVGSSIVPNESKQIDPATKERLQSYILKEGDIVIGRRGEIGRCAVVGRKEAGWICGTGCFFIRPLPTVNAQFLANLIRSGDYREQLERASTGATMKNLSNKALGDLVIAMPGLQVQASILAKLDALAEETQRLESLYQRKLAALDELKKSLLHQAFSGVL